MTIWTSHLFLIMMMLAANWYSSALGQETTPNGDVCLLPLDKGECDNQTMLPTAVYDYNRQTTMCEEFQYSGCGGNRNRFTNVTACRDTCYTSLDYFLAQVSEILTRKYN